MTIDLTVPDLATLHQRQSAKWSGQPADVLSLPVAEMDFPVAEPIAVALREAINRSDLGYPPKVATKMLDAFAAFAERRLDWRLDTEQVLVLPDVVASLLALGRLFEPGERVCFTVPAYPPFLHVLPSADLRTHPIEMRADGSLDLDQLQAALADGVRLLVLANPHNPTGRVLPREELEQIAELCASYDAYVFSDEIHAPLVLDGSSHTCWHDVSDAARDWGLVLTSASKAFNVAGLKAAMIVSAGGRGQQLLSRLIDVHPHPGLLGIVAAEAAFDHGDEWLDAVIAQLAFNREYLLAELKRVLPDVGYSPPQATYLAWLDCRKLGLGDDPAQPFLDYGRVALSPGPMFGEPGHGFARLNFGTSPEHLGDAVARMARAVELAPAPAP